MVLWGLLSMILWSLPYNIKCPEWTAVANWCDINKIKTKSLFNFCPGKRSGFFFFSTCGSVQIQHFTDISVH